MYNRSQEVQTTCFPMDAVDARMFVKQDLLGLRNLDTLADWQAQMREQGVEVDWSGMDKLEWPEEMWKFCSIRATRAASSRSRTVWVARWPARSSLARLRILVW
jgi:DNA polymerase III alpha subunit